MQPIVMTLMCLAAGESSVEETIFENRMMHVPELKKMGANILVQGRTAFISGGDLSGAQVRATDLRAAGALLIAGLAANGVTEILDAGYINRG